LNKEFLPLRWAPLLLVLWFSLLAGCTSVSTDVVRSSAEQQPLVSPEQLPLNYFQFFGSHNSYKTAISSEVLQQLRAVNAEAAASLEYWHEPLEVQLDMGLRVLELDVFYDPGYRLFSRNGLFPVLHVQNLDTGSHCENLAQCIDQIMVWSEQNPSHEPLLISFNTKTAKIDRPGFLTPKLFDVEAWRSFDAALRDGFGRKIINPAEVLSPEAPRWPSLAEARGKFLLLLDEGAEKYEAYHRAVNRPALFVNAKTDSPHAAIRVLNNPVADANAIEDAIAQGLLVRTRADADTVEARSGDTARRDAAFASGAHFVSTDYYKPALHFGTDYVVTLPGVGSGATSVRCNPKIGTRLLRAYKLTGENVCAIDSETR
jgi:hypothetical protein